MKKRKQVGGGGEIYFAAGGKMNLVQNINACNVTAGNTTAANDDTAVDNTSELDAANAPRKI